MVDRYTSREMADTWSDENKIHNWIRVERAFCHAWHVVGVIPTAKWIAIDNIFRDVLKDKDKICRNIVNVEAVTKHDVAAFLELLSLEFGELSNWIHLGMTSSDVVDTALSMAIRDSFKLICNRVDEDLFSAFNGIINKYDSLVMSGRTHGRRAEPITFGYKMRRHLNNIKCRWNDLDGAVDACCMVKTGGVVGMYSNVPVGSEDIFHNAICNDLDLGRDDYFDPTITSQILPRHLHANVITQMALFASVLEDLATDLRLLYIEGVDEINIGFLKDQVGSSAMPNKINPVALEKVCGMARLLRGYCMPAMDNIVSWNERDICNSSVERFIFPDAFSILEHIVATLAHEIPNIVVVDKDRKLNIYNNMLFYLQTHGIDRGRAWRFINDITIKDEECIDLLCKYYDSKCGDEYVKNIISKIGVLSS